MQVILTLSNIFLENAPKMNPKLSGWLEHGPKMNPKWVQNGTKMKDAVLVLGGRTV